MGTQNQFHGHHAHLLQVIKSERFLTQQGLGSEVPFFIFPYPPEHGTAIEDIQASLFKNLINAGIRIHTINLYDLSIALLRSRGIWDDIVTNESDWSKDELKELLQNVLDPAGHVIPAIRDELLGLEIQVLFINGVGEVFPYIRSHSILNNLQSVAKDYPTVMFFPGQYTHSTSAGASLDLFGRLHDDRYYRAFNILTYEI